MFARITSQFAAFAGAKGYKTEDFLLYAPKPPVEVLAPAKDGKPSGIGMMLKRHWESKQAPPKEAEDTDE